MIESVGYLSPRRSDLPLATSAALVLVAVAAALAALVVGVATTVALVRAPVAGTTATAAAIACRYESVDVHK